MECIDKIYQHAYWSWWLGSRVIFNTDTFFSVKTASNEFKLNFKFMS